MRLTWSTDTRDESSQRHSDLDNSVFVTDDEMAWPSLEDELWIVFGIEERLGTLDERPALTIAGMSSHGFENLVECFASFGIVYTTSRAIHRRDLDGGRDGSDVSL